MSALVSAPAPPIAPVMVNVVVGATSKVPPFAFSVVARLVVKLAVVASVPPSKLSPLVAAPRLSSAATCTVPPLIAVPPV